MRTGRPVRYKGKLYDCGCQIIPYKSRRGWRVYWEHCRSHALASGQPPGA